MRVGSLGGDCSSNIVGVKGKLLGLNDSFFPQKEKMVSWRLLNLAEFRSSESPALQELNRGHENGPGANVALDGSRLNAKLIADPKETADICIRRQQPNARTSFSRVLSSL
jgi:hypothetical protein